MKRMTPPGIAATVIVATVVAGVVGVGLAQGPTVPTTDQVTSRVLEIEPASGIAWTEDGVFISLFTDDGAPLAEVDLTDGSVTQLSLPGSPRLCPLERYHAPRATPSGGIAVVQSCFRPSAAPITRLVSVDVEQETISPLFSSSWQRMLLGAFALDSTGRVAIASVGDRLCNSLVEFEGDQVSRPRVMPAELVPVQGETGEQIEEGSNDCAALGIAEEPDVNAAGDLVFASYPGAAGVEGFDRFDVPGGVYLRKAGETGAEVLIDDIGEVRLAWNPDGSVLAISGAIASDTGTFLLDPVNDSLTKVSSTVVGSLAWSPDGRSLALLDWDEEVSRLTLLDVASMTAPPTSMGGTTSNPPTVRALSPIEIISIGWADAGLVAGVDDPETGIGLARIRGADGTLRPIDAPTESGRCSRLEYVNPVPLNRTEIAAVAFCVLRARAREVAQIVAVNVGHGGTRPLFSSGWIDTTLREFGIEPDLRSAVASEGSIICNSLVRITEADWSRPAVVPGELIPVQGQLGEAIRSGANDCDGLARTESPSVAADGTLAFVSSTSAAELSGMDRLDEPGALYLLPRGSVDAVRLVDEVSQATMRWSPDSSTLAVAGVVGGGEGLYLVDADTGEIERISSVRYIGVAWSPDGDQLALLRGAEDAEGATSVIQLMMASTRGTKSD